MGTLAAALLGTLTPAGIVGANVTFAFDAALVFPLGGMTLGCNATLALQIVAEFVSGEPLGVVVISMANLLRVDRAPAWKISADEDGCYRSLVAVSLGSGRHGQSASQKGNS